MSRDTNSDAPHGASEGPSRDPFARAQNLLFVDIMRFVYARRCEKKEDYSNFLCLHELLIEVAKREWLESTPDTRLLWDALPSASQKANRELSRWVSDVCPDIQAYLDSFDPTRLVPRRSLS